MYCIGQTNKQNTCPNSQSSPATALLTYIYSNRLNCMSAEDQLSATWIPQQQQQVSLPDAWQMIQFEKRLDANAEGINKVMTYSQQQIGLSDQLTL